LSGEAVLGEDSGLVVPAIGGLPGVYSARFAGPRAKAEENNRKLLKMMVHLPHSWQRRATFVSVVVLILGREIKFFRGQVEGVITTEPRGKAGFGYDPVFEIPAVGRTFAEMSLEEKNRYSHRAKAFWSLADFLRRIKEKG
ncbi:MAG: non-canonical purine NTP pyrophosphatase, partial [Candidatus Omnitrophica bacterium]|nr:non-canonical purine NTP pyrophosphatase [Candidatus Omnitrophota bacterium]